MRDSKRRIGWFVGVLTISMFIAAGGAGVEGSEATGEAVAEGARIYAASCSYCHGRFGQGDGPVTYFLSRSRAPRPRNFVVEPFKFRSTPSGELPTDVDLFRFISNGRPGLMPSFSGLSTRERWNVIAYIKTLVPEFSESPSIPEAIEIGPGVPYSSASVARGAKVYAELQCSQCHGPGGEGDGPSSATLQTETGVSILATKLTQPNSFGGGRAAEDIYRTFMTGMNGVPMPSYEGAVPEAQAWDLVNFVLSLGEDN